MTTLCRNGCGFYGNSQFDGMCSKCYKDAIKRRNQNPSPTPGLSSGRASPAVSPAMPDRSVVDSVVTSAVANLTPESLASLAPGGLASLAPGGLASLTSSLETASPTVPSVSSPQTSEESELDSSPCSSSGADSACSPSPSSSDKDEDGDKKKPKKSRCHSCKKKVGLTGFQCRCGGLYCSLHRYSDKHSCTFNYKELAQEQIRKNNPVVCGQKVQKI